MALPELDEPTANAIYDVLVREAGARDDEMERASFSMSYRVGRFGSLEYRFQGKLGFGGKFWDNAGRWYVSCYREDETPERLAIISKVNGILAEMRERAENERAENGHAL